jgi:organic radical activating enzyme
VIYPITEIFESLQGEGHFVGYRMTFVRLARCSIKHCHIRKECDEAPWREKESLSETEIAKRVKAGVVCITGGEPTDHDLLPLISVLRDRGCRVHLETSGVRSVAGYPLEWLTVSPKTNDYVQRTGHTLKVVVRPEWTESEAWNFIQNMDEGTEFFHRYLQPLTIDGRAANTANVVSLLMGDRNRDGRWALSNQAHRSWGLP